MTRPRRDPRAERAALAQPGGPRPRFALGSKMAGGRPRRDPRAELRALEVAAPTRLRLDRSHRAAGTTASATRNRDEPVPPAAPRVVLVEAPAFLVAVVPDAPGGRLSVHDRQLFGAARVLAGAEGGVVALVPAGCDGLDAAGADRVCLLPAQDTGYDPEGRAVALAAAFSTLAPRHVIFGETPDGGDLARRLASLTGEALFPDVELLSATSVTRPARGRRVEQRGAPARLMTLSPDAVAAYAGAPREARLLPTAVGETRSAATPYIEVRERLADPARVPLALADFVTAAGNGVTDFATFRAVVSALGATLGASRILCDAGLLPRAAQVGASGTVLAATCYLALGIAGAPQHLQGIAACEHVVAVNTDLHAAMMERAGLAIVQDAQLVMAALLAELAREAEEAS